MQIAAIHYPDGTKLVGWDKHVFERRMRKALDGEHFSICDLDRCRAVISGRENHGRSDAYEDLAAFHCVNYDEMSRDERALLLKNVEAFVGVGLTVKPSRERPVRVVKATLLVTATAVGVLLLTMLALKTPGPANAGSTLPVLPVIQQGAVAQEAEPTFSVSVISHTQASAIKRISRLVNDDGKAYTITVTSTPLDEPSLQK